MFDDTPDGSNNDHLSRSLELKFCKVFLSMLINNDLPRGNRQELPFVLLIKTLMEGKREVILMKGPDRNFLKREATSITT